MVLVILQGHELTNCLLRQYFSRAADLTAYSQAESWLNIQSEAPRPKGRELHYLQYFMWYNTDTFKNKNGDKVKSINEGPVTLNVETDLDVFVVAPNFVWVSPWKILGARYGAFMTPPS